MSLALVDRVGASLAYVQDTEGVWRGACPACGEEAYLGEIALNCTRCELHKPLEGFLPSRKLPAPLGIRELLAVPEPREEWLAEGLVPAGGNLLVAGHPKTFKTFFLLELAVAVSTATPFLERFSVPTRRRVGIVLMEDQAHRVRRRLSRLCAGRGVDLATLDGWLYVWSRPPLRLSDETAVELATYATECELDFLAVDSWSFVASGDSNSSDEVAPQLQALSLARAKRPGLTVSLVHHARKGEGHDELRLTDVIRNSGVFSAWYDSGLVLSRRDELSPVTVRTELRDYAAPEPFAFTVQDEFPGSAATGHKSSGWLRLFASVDSPKTVERRAVTGRLAPAVRDVLAEHPQGVSRSQLRKAIRGRAADIDAAFQSLVEAGEAEHVRPNGKGKSGLCRLVNGHLVPPGPDLVPDKLGTDLVHLVHTPVGGGPGPGSRPADVFDPVPRDQVPTCAAGCGQYVGRVGVTCGVCAAMSPMGERA
jgi:hypothetical protein